jgi:hypothetical protein
MIVPAYLVAELLLGTYLRRLISIPILTMIVILILLYVGAIIATLFGTTIEHWGNLHGHGSFAHFVVLISHILLYSAGGIALALGSFVYFVFRNPKGDRQRMHEVRESAP